MVDYERNRLWYFWVIYYTILNISNFFKFNIRIVTKPIEGVKNDGASGFFKGTW